MPTIEERLAALETFAMKLTEGDGLLKSLTVYGQTAPSVEKRLEMLEETVKKILDMNGQSYDLMTRTNDTMLTLVRQQEALALRVTEHDIIFQKMKEELKKARDEVGPFRKG